LFSNAKQQIGKRRSAQRPSKYVQFLCTHSCQFDTFARWQHFSTLNIKTLIIHLCLLIISDSVAVEIFAISQPCAKIFRKVWCATFFWDTV